jgi:hypothetical protein
MLATEFLGFFPYFIFFFIEEEMKKMIRDGNLQEGLDGEI